MKQTRRHVLGGIAAGVISTALAPARSAQSPSKQMRFKDVNDLFAQAMIIDDMAGFRPDEVNAQKSFEMLENSGVTIVSPTIGSVVAEESYESSITELAELAETVDRYPDRLILIRSYSDIEECQRRSKLGILANFQNTTAVGTDLSKLDLFYDLGVRQIQLTHNWRNWVGDGCTERTQAGLSYFGVDFVRRMNELGIVVDVGHSGYQTTLDAIEVSTKPIVFSHTNCMALCKHPRNKTDKQIRALADKGGVMGISTFNWFVSDKPRSTLDDLLDHFDYAVELVGPDHVGIGSDFGLPGYRGTEGDDKWQNHLRIYSEQEQKTLKVRWPPYIEQVNDEWRYKTIADGLLSRGYKEDVVLKILGLNFKRVFQDAMATS